MGLKSLASTPRARADARVCNVIQGLPPPNS